PARRPAQHPSSAGRPPTRPPGRPGPWATPPPPPPAAPPKRSPSSTPNPPRGVTRATPVTRVTTNNGTEHQPDTFPQDPRGTLIARCRTGASDTNAQRPRHRTDIRRSYRRNTYQIHRDS